MISHRFYILQYVPSRLILWPRQWDMLPVWSRAILWWCWCPQLHWLCRWYVTRFLFGASLYTSSGCRLWDVNMPDHQNPWQLFTFRQDITRTQRGLPRVNNVLRESTVTSLPVPRAQTALPVSALWCSPCVCVPSGSSPVCGLLFVIVMQLAGIVQGMLQIFNTIKPPYTGTISTAQGSTQCSQCPAGTTSLPG